VNSSTPFRRLKRDVQGGTRSKDRATAQPSDPHIHTHQHERSILLGETIRIATEVGLVTHSQVPLFREINSPEEANAN